MLLHPIVGRSVWKGLRIYTAIDFLAALVQPFNSSCAPGWTFSEGRGWPFTIRERTSCTGYRGSRLSLMESSFFIPRFSPQIQCTRSPAKIRKDGNRLLKATTLHPIDAMLFPPNPRPVAGRKKACPADWRTDRLLKKQAGNEGPLRKGMPSVSSLSLF